MVLNNRATSDRGSFAFEASAYLKYCLHAVGKHSVHSPFVYHLITDVFNTSKQYACFATIEQLRDVLLADDRIIHVNDLGAGSRKDKSNRRKVANIAASALQPRWTAQCLFKLVNHLQPATIIELGTSLGITTAYLANGNLKAKVITIEGASEVAEIAKENFGQLGLSEIEVITQSFDLALPALIESIAHPAFVLIDGNHTHSATINYFELLHSKMGAGSVMVLDDIHWSAGMERAWHELKDHKSVQLSLDFFEFGLLFFDGKRAREHFTLKRPA
jgi:predicted O-methyltransferase YrrM